MLSVVNLWQRAPQSGLLQVVWGAGEEGVVITVAEEGCSFAER